MPLQGDLFLVVTTDSVVIYQEFVMAKKSNKVIDAEAVVKDVPEKEAAQVENLDDGIGKIELTAAAQALAELQASPDAEDILFKKMSKADRDKFGVSLSEQQLEERHSHSRESMNVNRVEYALSCYRLMHRQPWRKPNAEGQMTSRVDYFERHLRDSFNTVLRHQRAVKCLLIMDIAPSELHRYKYRRLAAFLDKVEKNVATHEDFKILEPKMLELPDNAADILTDKEFDNEMKQRFSQREAELSDLEGEDDNKLKRISFEIPAYQEKHILEAHRMAMDIAKEEGRDAPGLGGMIIEAVSSWFSSVGQGRKYITAEEMRQLYQEAYKIALIPFRIHKYQKTEGLKGLPSMRIFQVGDYYVLEEEPRHAAKVLGVKVDQIKEIRINVGSYLIRTGVMEEDDEEVAKAQDVLEKKFAKPVEEKEKPKAAAKPKAEKKADKDDDADKKKPAKQQKAKKKLSEMTDNEVSVTITKIKKKLKLSDEDFKELSEGKEPKRVLKELVELQKAAG